MTQCKLENHTKSMKKNILSQTQELVINSINYQSLVICDRVGKHNLITIIQEGILYNGFFLQL